MAVNDKSPKQGWKNYIKYGIWLVLVMSVFVQLIGCGKELKVDFFYQTDHGISISNIYCYIIYYIVIIVVFVPAILFGKRTFCHYFCWINPFMIFGRRLGKRLPIKQLSLETEPASCIDCHMCDKNCTMSVKVSEQVKKGEIYDDECILCGACIDCCPKKVINYKMK